LTVNHLIHKVLAGEKGKVPDELFITGASYIYQTTQFPQTTKNITTRICCSGWTLTLELVVICLSKYI